MASNSYGWMTPTYTQPKDTYSTQQIQPQTQVRNARVGNAPADLGYSNQQIQPTQTYGGNTQLPGYGDYNPAAPMNSIDQWRGSASTGFDELSWYSSDKNRAAAQAYANSYLTPYFNAELASRTQGFNEQNAMANFYEQQRLNSSQMDLANRASGREDQALAFSQKQFGMEFGEGQRQFNQNLAFQRDMGQGQLNNQMFSNQTDRQNVQNQFTLGQGQLNNQSYANQTDRINVSNQYNLGQYANQTDRLNANNQFTLGQYANQTDRMNAQTQLQLGQGQLGFQNRELASNDAYRYQALAQEAQLTNRRLNNEMMQSRYAAFGRAQAPNARTIRSWS